MYRFSTLSSVAIQNVKNFFDVVDRGYIIAMDRKAKTYFAHDVIWLAAMLGPAISLSTGLSLKVKSLNKTIQ